MSAELKKDELFKAAKNLDTHRIEYCIQCGLDPNDLDQFGKPPLSHVIKEGTSKNMQTPEFDKVRETIQVLLFYGAKLNNLNKREKSLLDDFMRGYKGKKINPLNTSSKSQTNVSNSSSEIQKQIVNPNLVKPTIPTQKQKELIEELKFEMLKKDGFLAKEYLIQKITTFFDFHLESILLSLIGVSLPIYLLNFFGQKLYARDEFWSKTSLLVVLPIFVFSVFLVRDFWKEKKIFRFIITVPSLVSSLGFILFLFYIQIPQFHNMRISNEYKECLSSNLPKCSPMQNGIYQDFLFGEEGKYLRKDESLLFALADGIRPHSIWSKLGTGDPTEQRILQEEFARRGLVYYISQLENKKSPDEIFSDHEGNLVFYSIAFGEANPDLLDLENMPEEIKAQLNLSPSENFPLGILNQERIDAFFKSLEKDINGLSIEETELAFYFLTQFPVNLDETTFQSLLEHWIEYKKQFEKELRYMAFVRSQIREQLLAIKKEDIPVGVKFLEESDYSFYKPLLMSTGVNFTKGEDISLTFHLQSESSNDSKQTSRVIFPEIISTENEIPIYTLLSDGVLPEVNETYRSTKEETWIYALPFSFVCKIGCN